MPLSACALFSARPAECATPETQTRCDQMDMQQNGTQLAAASDTSCCFVSKAPAPVPESQYKASDLSLASTATVVPDPLGNMPRVRHLQPVVLVQNLSPPRLQSILCTFLI